MYVISQKMRWAAGSLLSLQIATHFAKTADVVKYVTLSSNRVC